MKQSWEIKKLGDVCDIITKGTTPTSLGFKFTDAGVNFIKVESLTESGEIIPNKVAYISEECHQSLKRSQLKVNDILFSIAGALGRIGIVNEEIVPANTNQALAIIRLAKDSGILVSFLAKYFTSNNILEEIEKLKGGAAQQNLSLGQLNNLSIPLPPFPEQQRIVAILDEAFAAIAQAKYNAEQNLKNAKELFESYLQSVFENKGEGWEEKTLGDVCSLYQGIAINAKTKHALVEKSDLPLLRIKDLKNNTVEQYIDPNNYPANALVNEEDIIYTRTGSLGLVFRGKRGVLHNNSFKVVPNSELTKDYLFIWLQNPIFKNRIMGLAMKAAQPDITHAIFKIQEIAVPPLKEQQAIVQKLDALSAETKQLETIYQQKINDLDELKKSILQKAFAGELNTTALEV